MPEPRRSDLPRGIFRFHDRYRVRIYHEGVQHSLGVYETLRDAKAAAAIARGEMARGIFIPPSQRRREIRDTALQERVQSLTVTDWAADWLQRLESMGRSLGTTRSYSSTLKVHVLPALGDRRLVAAERGRTGLTDRVRPPMEACTRRNEAWILVPRLAAHGTDRLRAARGHSRRADALWRSQEHRSRITLPSSETARLRRCSTQRSRADWTLRAAEVGLS